MAKSTTGEKNITKSAVEAAEGGDDAAKRKAPTTGSGADAQADAKADDRADARVKKATKKRASSKRAPSKKTISSDTHGQENVNSPVQTAVRALDRSELPETIRVHVLAKKMGVTSRDLTAELARLGMKKVAQSSLKSAEVDALFTAAQESNGDHVDLPESGNAVSIEQPKKTDKPAKKTTKKTAKRTSKKKTSVKPEESESTPLTDPAEEASSLAGGAHGSEDVARLRDRVQKNVANEIQQMERKVEADLQAEIDTAGASQKEPDRNESHADGNDAAEDKLRERVRKDVANEINQIQQKVEADLEDAALAIASEERLHDVASDTTPAPSRSEQETSELAPVFVAPAAENDEDNESSSNRRRSGGRDRRRSRRRSTRTVDTESSVHEEQETFVETEADTAGETSLVEEPVAIKGSTRLEAQRRRRSEMREAGRKRQHIVTQAEFLARRESVERTMVVREREFEDRPGSVAQVGVLEDGMLVEHFVTSEAQSSMIGNIYLGRVQNVLPSMEAAFIDIGTGRNGVLYASDLDWKTAGLGGRARKIEQALKSGDQVLVQVSKDPLGHKGPRLTTQISLAGRFLVYVPGGRSAGISRKLPGHERKRLKEILERVIPGKGGAIIRTAAENTSEEAIAADVRRLDRTWQDIQARAEEERNSKGAKPVTLYEEPDMLIKVVRDVFNEDFSNLIVDGKRAWNIVRAYVGSVAPDLQSRLERYHRADHNGADAFEHYRINEQIQKALSRKVWLPSGGHLVIDRTEAMVVIDVNTGKFTGSGGNLEETVTRNNLEAAEEIVRQMRLRDLGGMIVVDFIDMVLEENQDLVLRRLKEALGRDRTRHQVSEVTSLGLVQMTRKRLGTGLLETFSSQCRTCEGRGVVIHDTPVQYLSLDEGKTSTDSEERAKDHSTSEAKADTRAGHSSDSRRDVGLDSKPGSRDHAKTTSKAKAKKSRGHAKAPSDAELERIASSVFGDVDVAEERASESHKEAAVSKDADQAVAEAGRGERRETEEGNRPRRAHKRRGRRGGNRGRGKEPAQLDVQDVAASAVAEAKRHDPDEPSDERYVSDDEAFDKALAEFEASPRRRRRTRGNSVSDRRPRREDFVRPVVEEVSVGEDTPADESSEAPASRADRHVKDGVNNKTDGRVRKRRRVVRRSAQSKSELSQSESSQSGEVASGSGAPASGEVVRGSGANRSRAKVHRSARGRRRVTRRLSRD